MATGILARITHIYGEAPPRDFGSDTLNYFIADARNHDELFHYWKLIVSVTDRWKAFMESEMNMAWLNHEPSVSFDILFTLCRLKLTKIP